MKVFSHEKLFDGADTLTVQKRAETSCEIHTHEFFEFVFIAKGVGTHKIDGTEYKVKRGSLLFINFDQTHEFIMDEGSEYYNILLLPEYIGLGLRRETAAVYDLFSLVLELGDCRQCVLFSGTDTERVECLVKMLYDEYSFKPSDKEIMRDALHIIELLALKNLREGKNDLTSPKIAEVIEYLKTNYARNPSLTELSEKFYYNSSYFSRLFKKLTGTGYNAYLNSLKISEAVKLLNSTDMTVDAISQAVGYSDYKTFYTQFKKFTGTIPTNFRK